MKTHFARILTLSLGTLVLLFGTLTTSTTRAGIRWCNSIEGTPWSNFEHRDSCARLCYNKTCKKVEWDCYEACEEEKRLSVPLCPEGMELSLSVLGMCYPECPEGSYSDRGLMCRSCANGDQPDYVGFCPTPQSEPVQILPGLYQWSPQGVPAAWYSRADHGVRATCAPGRSLFFARCSLDF